MTSWSKHRMKGSGLIQGLEALGMMEEGGQVGEKTWQGWAQRESEK